MKDDGEPPLLLSSRKKLEGGFCADLEQSLGTAFGTGSDSHGHCVRFLQSSPFTGVQNTDLLACVQRGSWGRLYKAFRFVRAAQQQQRA